MDFITGLPPSNGSTAILIINDRLSKYGHFISLPTSYTAAKVAALFSKEYYRLHGFPKVILSDRDPIFMSHFWSELMKLSGITPQHFTRKPTAKPR